MYVHLGITSQLHKKFVSTKWGLWSCRKSIFMALQSQFLWHCSRNSITLNACTAT